MTVEEVADRRVEDVRILLAQRDSSTDVVAVECPKVNPRTIGDELETIEDSVLTRPDQTLMARIFALKTRLVSMRKILSPQRVPIS